MKNKFIQLFIVSALSFTVVQAEDYLNCKDTYYKLNKHNKRAGIFIDNSDWVMADYYIEKIKDDYRYFYANNCFEKTFRKDAVEKMKIKYRANIETIKNLSSLAKEAIAQKEKEDRKRILMELEEKKKMERDKIREEVRAELLREKKYETVEKELIKNDNSSDNINSKEEFMKKYLEIRGDDVRIIDLKK